MRFNFASKIVNEYRNLAKHPALRRFMEHNQKVFPTDKDVARRKPVVLFELNAMHSAHIAYSYLANVLATSNQAKIVAYVQKPYRRTLQRLLFRIRRATGQNEFGAYQSFGTTAFVEIELSPKQRDRALSVYVATFERLQSKLDIEALTINGVWVGDLVYDSFLMTYKQPTIDKESAEFKQSLLDSIECFVFWEDYLDNHDVKAINVSHCVYNLAIPLRIALKKDIPVFHANVTHIYRLNSANLFAYNDFVYFRERFASLPPEVQQSGIAEAKRRIERRFAGEVGVDMAYSTKSAYGASRHPRLLKASDRKKILIATHCFFDSPHSYGNNIFPDFYEWLDFLGTIAEGSNYDWYIKTHPDYLPGTKEIIEAFIAKYPKFMLLPADASHHQIIAEGIDLALTVYGTIAFEYAALGIPVINASQNNPHIAYDFNLHAKDIDDYRRLLMGVDWLEFKIDKQQVYEYYFMRHIFNTENLFFDNYGRTLEELNGYDGQFTPAVYEKWLAQWTPEKHGATTTALQSFIKSGDFRMDYRHYGREFSIESIHRNL